MTSVMQRSPTYFKQKGKISGLSGSVLKLLAIVLMLMDHASVAFFGDNMTVLRIFGRVAFPIFAFFIAEGAHRTKNIYKYMLRLGIFAIVSEIPFDLVLFEDGWFSLRHQNVYFTLLLGLIAIWSYQMLSKKHLGILSVLTAGILALAADFLFTDYGSSGVLFIFAVYFIIKLKPLPKAILLIMCCIGLCFLFYNGSLYFTETEIYAVFAVIPIMLYNGKKGFKLNKFFFYGFYPGHLIILWLLTLVLKH